MDRYRRFTVEMTALTIELNRSSGPAKDGKVPVDARLLNEAVRLSARSRQTMNHHLEYKLGESVRDLQRRFKLPQVELDPQAVEDEPKAKEKAPDES